MSEIHFIDGLTNDGPLSLHCRLLSDWTNCSVAGKTAVRFAVLRGVRVTHFYIFAWICKVWLSFLCCVVVWFVMLGSPCSSGCLVLTCLDPPASVCQTPGTFHYTTLRVSFTSFSSSDSCLQMEIGNNRGPLWLPSFVSEVEYTFFPHIILTQIQNNVVLCNSESWDSWAHIHPEISQWAEV